MLGSLQDAEDALQDTLLRAWRHLDGLTGPDALRAWLYRTATNRCLSLKAVRRRGPVGQAVRAVTAFITDQPEAILFSLGLLALILALCSHLLAK